MNLYPINLKLEGRLCLVVGGGPVGERKISGLLECGAGVRVVSPGATALVARWAEAGRITLLRREFIPADLAGVFLVLAATDSAATNEKVATLAAERGLLVNVADTPPLCDFYLPAIARRGPLSIAVSTGGVSPGLAARLRDEAAALCGPEYEEYLELLAAYRQKAFALWPREEEERREILLRLTGAEALRRLDENGLSGLRSYLADLWAEYARS
ncbi:MAG: bifunctional precorrin-2 dehydrogenase/sirohydrochlorin ferrochelatase [Gracilibacteraceae bacterium]|jgi:precorrin-2 dehydrogenase/sirohydrochlorin ferrochelatase|nr:bifunctional precorrin-2 dehydrogenase/sirohydrochlorin ferrochelatase [Gracilibacteraceae bacterium]